MSRWPPAPDPFEPSGLPPDAGLELPAPTVVFLKGSPTPEVEVLSNAILAARPGVLFVYRAT
jgi:hypothetical protein